jgi:hypothetical protein
MCNEIELIVGKLKHWRGNYMARDMDLAIAFIRKQQARIDELEELQSPPVRENFPFRWTFIEEAT